MSSTYDELFMKAQKFGQEHLFTFYDELDEDQKQTLLKSVKDTDFEKIISLYENAEKIESCQNIESIPAIDKAKISKEQLKHFAELGIAAMKNGEYAVVTMAGGQGTRLSFDGPKGLYDIGLPSHKTLFEIQLDRIKAMSKQVGKNIPWYIMTSQENHETIETFLKEKHYFDYPSSDIVLFRQSALPMISNEGKILMEEKYKMKEGSDGNGAIFRSMKDTGVFSDMQKRGVKWFFACNVDNVLVQCVDVAFLGLAIFKDAQCISKSVIKSNAHEKVGVFCYKDGKPGVVEYSELSETMAEMTNQNGEWVYGDSHISCTLFSVKAAGQEVCMHLPYHTAKKKADFIDVTGARVDPKETNAYKFEAFIFDAFANFDRFFVFRVDREEEFAPVKNKEGEDSPQTARDLFVRYQQKFQ